MIGDLDKRVTFQQEVRTADGGGGFSVTWQSIAANPSVFAQISELSQSEQFRFHQMESTATHRIIVRYRDDIDTSMRIMNGTKVYYIESFSNMGGQEKYLEIMARG